VDFRGRLAARLLVSLFGLSAVAAAPSLRAALAGEAEVLAFMDRHCATCHNDVDKEGGFDLTSLKFTPSDPENFHTWVKMFDRVSHGEMPPKEKKRPEAADIATFTKNISTSLVGAEEQMIAQSGRAARRRLNRSEYENALRDLLSAPWLQVQGTLPEDGESSGSNKISKALEVSYVHMQKYVEASKNAMRQVLATKFSRPETKVTRYWARESVSFSSQDGTPDRGRFPVLGNGPDFPALTRMAPLTVGESDPAKRELEGMAWTASHFQIGNNYPWSYRAPVSGYYNLRFKAQSIWVGPNGSRVKGMVPNDALTDEKSIAHSYVAPEWYRPNHADVTVGRRSEPIKVYTKTGGRGEGYYGEVGRFDVEPEVKEFELKNVYLPLGGNIATDAVRFFRSRPGFTAIDSYTNQFSQRDGMPGVAFRWMDVEGPIYSEESDAGYKLLFGDLPIKAATDPKSSVPVEVMGMVMGGARGGRGGQAQAGGAEGQMGTPGVRPQLVEVESANPQQDAERLIRNFLGKAYRRPVQDQDVARFVSLFKKWHGEGLGFAGSMLAAYTAALASPEFVFLQEAPGKLDNFALADRLSLFLWNSTPDARLRELAAKGELSKPAVLKAETARLLDDPKSQRFVNSFLDYWLDVRKMDETSPDLSLYNDYFIDDALKEAALDESRMFFGELVKQNYPARNVVDSDFVFINDRLAEHYGMSGVKGVHMRKVALPVNSPRGGIMTQAIVLKVTANGSTTSPVLRGKWIMERIVGFEMPPPPAAVPAVEPDIRGAVTIRQQLDKHRADESCAQCHRKIDPPGFALESFDVMGAWRDRYRALAANGQIPARGFGHNGWPLAFYYALPVDPSGATADGRPFKDIQEFKKLLLQDETQIGRNLVKQLSIFATGAPVRFSDRTKIDAILEKTRASQYGVRSIIEEIVQSDLFLNK
jgi:mono/diheme cytochrome c family protein